MCDVLVDAIGFLVILGRPEIMTCVGGGGGGSSRPFGQVVEVVVVVVTANHSRFRKKIGIRLIVRGRYRCGYK